MGLQEGGEAEPSIFSWLKGTFQFDWKIFLYFGGEKYDAFGKLGNLNIIPIVCCYNFFAMLYSWFIRSTKVRISNDFPYFSILKLVSTTLK